MNDNFLALSLIFNSFGEYHLESSDIHSRLTSEKLDRAYFDSLMELLKVTRGLISHEDFSSNYKILSNLSSEEQIIINDEIVKIVNEINSKLDNENKITR